MELHVYIIKYRTESENTLLTSVAENTDAFFLVACIISSLHDKLNNMPVMQYAGLNATRVE